MKVIAINGSPHPDGNTRRLINMVLAELSAEGIEGEVIQLGGRPVHGCLGCMRCFSNKNGQCAIQTDPVNELIRKIREADGLIIGSPTHFVNVTAEVKAFIDRAGLVSKANGGLFRHKPGVAVVAVRRGGAVCAYDAINHFYALMEMIVPASVYWNFGVGLLPGEVDNDAEGVETMKVLGANLAWVMKRIG